MVEEYHNQCEVLLDKGMLLPGSFLMYSDPEDLPGRFARFQTVYLNSLDEGETLTEVKKQYSLYGNNTVSYAGRIDELKKDIKAWLEKGYQITIQAMSDQRKEGLKNFLEENGIRSIRNIQRTTRHASL